jgi:hypothetical protein
MKKVIVTTSINPPTEAIRAFEKMKAWDLVVIGDKKMPAGYRLERGIYVSPEEQEKYDPVLSEAIGWNCIQRRNFGLLWAKDMKADVVALIDDDNIPLAGWGENPMVGREVELDVYETDLPAFDPLGATNHGWLWHRGYPLQLLSRRDYGRKTRRRIRVDVQADFWNGDPDIDAICRMEHSPECDFNPAPFPFAADKMSPFNSQNTFLSGNALKDYFLFPDVGRMDDIWAAYYLQAKGYRVAYGKASVYHKRNVHDLTRDMKQEYLGYESTLRLVESLAKDPESILAFLPGRAAWAAQLYRKHFSASA